MSTAGAAAASTQAAACSGAAQPGVGVVAGLKRGGGAAERGHRMAAARVAEQGVQRHARRQARLRQRPARALGVRLGDGGSLAVARLGLGDESWLGCTEDHVIVADPAGVT